VRSEELEHGESSWGLRWNLQRYLKQQVCQLLRCLDSGSSSGLPSLGARSETSNINVTADLTSSRVMSSIIA